MKKIVKFNIFIMIAVIVFEIWITFENSEYWKIFSRIALFLTFIVAFGNIWIFTKGNFSLLLGCKEVLSQLRKLILIFPHKSNREQSKHQSQQIEQRKHQNKQRRFAITEFYKSKHQLLLQSLKRYPPIKKHNFGHKKDKSYMKIILYLPILSKIKYSVFHFPSKLSPLIKSINLFMHCYVVILKILLLNILFSIFSMGKCLFNCRCYVVKRFFGGIPQYLLLVDKNA